MLLFCLLYGSFPPSELFCSTACWALASLSLSLVILLCTHSFARANLFPQNGRDCLSQGEELCPRELFWSDKQTAADWTGTSLALLPPGLSLVQKHSHAWMMGLGSRAAVEADCRDC